MPFVVSPHPGLLIPGNLDLFKRPIVHNKDGTISTAETFSAQWNRGQAPHLIPWKRIPARYKTVQVLMPSVYNRAHHPLNVAMQHAVQTGQHMGILDTVKHAEAYSWVVHWAQVVYLKKKGIIQ